MGNAGLKIMYIDQQYRFSGGVEQYVYSVTNGLEQMGHEIIAVYGIKSENTHHFRGRNEYWVPGIEKVPHLFVRNDIALKRVTEIIKSDKPDLIHVHNIRNFAVIKRCSDLAPTIRTVHDPTLCCYRDWKLLPDLNRICTKRVGINCLFTGCLSQYHESPLSAIPKKYKEIKVHKELSRIIVSSNYMKDLLVQNKIPSEKIRILPYFTHTQDLDSPSFPADQNIILYVGLIHLIKGVDKLIAALKHLKKDFKAIIIGQGDYLEQYKNIANELGLEEKIQFIGWVPNEDLSSYYRQASVLAVPSWWAEAFGIVGIEAMANARPVVAFRTGGIPDWLEDRETGFLVERGDIKGLAEKISLLLDNKDLARRMGENGRQKVLAKYQLDTHLNALLKIYQDCIK
jgi:glycosyltransferase involved in cell wall biosynthesis